MQEDAQKNTEKSTDWSLAIGPRRDSPAGPASTWRDHCATRPIEGGAAAAFLKSYWSDILRTLIESE